LLEQAKFIMEHLILGARLSFQATVRVVNTLIEVFRKDWLPISSSTVRLWFIRLGVFAFQSAKIQANDWILLVDHMVQLGEEKCLAVFGIRASELPPRGTALRLSDLHPLAIFATATTNKQVVKDQLESVMKIIGGPPLAFLSDEGAELVNGIKLFCEDRETKAFLDIAHKASNLLKKAIVSDDAWAEYNKTISNIAARSRLTAASFLTPPSQRSKARFMNLGDQLRWAKKSLTILDDPSRVSKHISREVLEEKLGPLRTHREAIHKWCLLQELCDVAIKVVGQHGYGEATVETLRTEIAPRINPVTHDLATALLDFVAGQCRKLPSNYRIAASTEILESALGRYKATAGDHVHAGFTSLLPAIGALTGKFKPSQLYTALQQTPVKKAQAFVRELLGTTYHTKRREAFTPTTT
jgi:hypothetical protein